MRLTTEVVQQFVGGQMEIQNEGEGYIYRGEIRAVVVENNEFRVTFKWVAKGVGTIPAIERWVNDNNLNYALGLDISSISNIGPSGGEIGGGDRFCINSAFIGEVVVLYPPDGSKLDPSRVEGLDLPQSQPA